MYVPYSRFSELTLGSENDGITEEQYARVSSIADSIIDDWTLGRVGRAIMNGEELPEKVVTVYVAICEAIPAIMDGSKNAGGLVTSFSNGVDSYSFAVTEELATELRNRVGWMVGMLPIEWCSAVASFEGGNRYAG